MEQFFGDVGGDSFARRNDDWGREQPFGNQGQQAGGNMGMMRGPNQGSGQGAGGQQVVMVVPQGNTGAGVSHRFFGSAMFQLFFCGKRSEKVAVINSSFDISGYSTACAGDSEPICDATAATDAGHRGEFACLQF